MKMKKSLLALSMLTAFLVPQAVSAYDIIDANTVRVYAGYIEPTENTDGSPIKGLESIQILYRFGQTSSYTLAVPVIPALSPNGGGIRSQQAVDIIYPEGLSGSVDFIARSVLVGGITSLDSPIITLQIDHPIPKPNAPAQFMIQ